GPGEQGRQRHRRRPAGTTAGRGARRAARHGPKVTRGAHGARLGLAPPAIRATARRGTTAGGSAAAWPGGRTAAGHGERPGHAVPRDRAVAEPEPDRDRAWTGP